MKNQRRTKYGFRTYVKVAGLDQLEKNWKRDSTQDDRTAWIIEHRAKLKAEQRKLHREPRVKGSFDADALGYLKAVKLTLDPATFRSRVCEIDAWRDAFAGEPRSAITRDRLLEIRRIWLTEHAGKRTGSTLSVKTVKNREGALRHLFHVLDGRRAPTPLDDLPPLKVPRAQPRMVSVRRIRAVAKRLRDPLTRAIFMVLASTGQRPAQLRRTHRSQVDLRRGVWNVQPAKAGHPIPVPMSPDMIVAFKALIAAGGFDAQGRCRHFDSSDFAKALYAAGWPKDVPPYNLKHTMAITLAEHGAEWNDIKDWFGHTDVKTTEIYTGFVRPRIKALGETLTGRIGWTLPADSQPRAKERDGKRRKRA